MKKIIFISLLGLVLCLIIIHYFYIIPKYIEGWNKRLSKEFEMHIVYKNSQKGSYLYLDHDTSLILKYEDLKEFEAFKKPSEGKDVEIVLYSDTAFYDNAKVGDVVQKMANSNMCFLYRNDSIFRYNCQLIPKLAKKEIVAPTEWSKSEIGFWKIR